MLHRAIRAESKRYFRRSANKLEWLDRVAEIGDRPGLLVLVTLRGNCDVTTETETTHASQPMGAVLATDGHVMPYVFLDCDRIRLALDRARAEQCLPETWELLARALVRVFEHELMHVFHDSRAHQAHGIGASAVSAEMLTDPFRESEGIAAAPKVSPQSAETCARRGFI